MLPESHSAVVARNEMWRGSAVTEPYEAGWAHEAIVFVRALAVEGTGAAEVRVQISPDGMHWADEGTTFGLPRAADQVTFARVRHFGGWLRIAAEMPAGLTVTVVVSIALEA